MELGVAAVHRRGDLRGGDEGWDLNVRLAAMTGIVLKTKMRSGKW